MKTTKVIRVDGDFERMIDHGRRTWQAATGKRVTTPFYTAQLAIMMKPLLDFNSQAKSMGNLRSGVRYKRQSRA